MSGCEREEQTRPSVTRPDRKEEALLRFGFSVKRGSVHTSRTMMLRELTRLFASVPEKAAHESYMSSIIADNCLGKRSGVTRKLSAKSLSGLYILNLDKVLFRAFRFFWRRDAQAHPLISLLCTYARDAILRQSAEYILTVPVGTAAHKAEMEQFIEEKYPDRFSDGMLHSLVRNIRSTWTQSGHLEGHLTKIRSQAAATPGAVAYALLLGYLAGARGEFLFATEYARLLDCSVARSIELAEEASRRGWIVFKRVGTVIEALFPNLLTEQEMEWIREPN
ncbi:MAG TPA: hypothetical protein ENI27_01135 [bacterium]|nr:hypothetical protein [bacterium]